MKTTLLTIQAKVKFHEAKISELKDAKKKAVEKMMLAVKDSDMNRLTVTFLAVKPEDKVTGKQLVLLYNWANWANGEKIDPSQELEDKARREQGALFSALNEAKQAGLYSGNLASIKGHGFTQERASVLSVIDDTPIGHLIHWLRGEAIMSAHDKLVKGKMPTSIMKPCASNKDKEGNIITSVVEFDGYFIRYDMELARKLLSVMGVDGVSKMSSAQVIERIDSFRVANHKDVSDSAPLQIASPAKDAPVKARRTKKAA